MINVNRRTEVTDLRILLAVPDRDLLSGLAKYLEGRGHDVVTAFDGIKAIERIRAGSFDSAVIDDDLPRVPSAKVLSLLSDAGVRATVLTKERIDAATICGEPCAAAYLRYPFLPEEITNALGAMARDGEPGDFTLCDVTVSPSRRTLGERRGLTDEEIAILRTLSDGNAVSYNVPYYYIEALNMKLSAQNARCRIAYRVNEGFRMVMKDE